MNLIKTNGKPEITDEIVVVFKYANGRVFSDVGFAEDYVWVEDYDFNGNKLIETSYIETYKLKLSEDFKVLDTLDDDILVFCIGSNHNFVDEISDIDWSRFTFNKVLKFSILNIE